MTKLWRLSLEKHAATASSGQGSFLYGGRWSPVGCPAVYLSESVSLTVLETLVHADTAVWATPAAPRHVVFAVNVPDDIVIEAVSADDLSADWNVTPAPAALQDIGSSWFDRAASPLLRVPSAIVKQESNFLFNPLHPDASRIEIGEPESFGVDGQLWR